MSNISTIGPAHEAVHELEEPHHPGPLLYGIIAIALCILTGLELTVFYVKAVEPILIPLLIILAIAKFALVAMFYMHLKFDSRVFSSLFIFPLLLALTITISLLLLFLYLQHHPQELHLQKTPSPVTTDAAPVTPPRVT